VFAVGDTWEEMFRTTDASRLVGTGRFSSGKFCAYGSSIGRGVVYCFDTDDSSYTETYRTEQNCNFTDITLGASQSFAVWGNYGSGQTI
jgi:hypothetical protein